MFLFHILSREAPPAIFHDFSHFKNLQKASLAGSGDETTKPTQASLLTK